MLSALTRKLLSRSGLSRRALDALDSEIGAGAAEPETFSMASDDGFPGSQWWPNVQTIEAVRVGRVITMSFNIGRDVPGDPALTDDWETINPEEPLPERFRPGRAVGGYSWVDAPVLVDTRGAGGAGTYISALFEVYGDDGLLYFKLVDDLPVGGTEILIIGALSYLGESD